MRPYIAIIGYVICFLLLLKLWNGVMFWQHELVGKPPIFERIIFPGFILPFILGVGCAAIIKPKVLTNYWPILVAPTVTLIVRLILDDASKNWLSQNIASLIGLGIGSSILFSMLGAWLYSKYILRLK